MMKMKPLFRTILAAGLAISASAWAQSYPAKPVRMIVAFPAGGGSDIVGRIVAAKLSERLGQQVVVENRAGGGGSIGAEAAVKAAPDGYTISLAGTSEMAINPFIKAEAARWGKVVADSGAKAD